MMRADESCRKSQTCDTHGRVRARGRRMAGKLSPNEIRDITTLLEQGKPLPEKYRFVLFGDQRNVELVWDGKSNAVTDVQLPFQVIEQVDEPRSEKVMKQQFDLFDAASGRQLKGWSNKLIWGDNKFVLSSLRSGPVRDEIEKNGGLKFCFIDPPFDLGANFEISVRVADTEFAKAPTVLEEIAYRDTWGRGTDSFLQMLYERLILIKQLLRDDGMLALLMGDKVASSVKQLLVEVFGEENVRNTLIIQRGIKNVQAQFDNIRSLSVGHDFVFLVSKKSDTRIPKLSLPDAKEQSGKWDTFWRSTDRPTMRYELFGQIPKSGQWRWKKDRASWATNNYEQFVQSGAASLDEYYFEKLKTGEEMNFLRLSDAGSVQYYVPPRDYVMANTNLTSIKTVGSVTDYPTEKHEQLVSVLIEWLTEKDDIVADFFIGSGTTLAVAEKLGRKWIGSDLGKFAIHTTRKRLIVAQRELKASNKDWRAFELLNLGKYERGMLVANHTGLDSDALLDQIQLQKDAAFEQLILQAYGAQRIENSSVFVGSKFNRLITIGPVNLPVTRLFVERVIDECKRSNVTKADVIAFEYEMGLFPNIQEEGRKFGVDIAFKYIPRDIFDKRAVAAGQVRFHDVAYIEVRPQLSGKTLSIELVDYSVGYQQDSVDSVERDLGKGGTKVVVEQGKVVKLEKDKDGIVKRTTLTKHWSDWIDYWAIDWDFQNRKELVNIKSINTGEWETKWTGDFVFENEWQSFRTKKDRKLDLVSGAAEMPAGKRKVAIKVVDIFGNDTMKVIEINVGKA